MRSNPPWTTKILTTHWEKIRSRVGEAWLPTLAAGKKKSYVEYGCGHYGCVMPTNTPGVVIKITTDPTEAFFVAAYLSMRNKIPGIVPYYKIFAIRSESHRRRPVFVLWRDEAQYVGDIRKYLAVGLRGNEQEYYHRSWKTAQNHLFSCREAASTIRKLVNKKKNAAELLAAGMDMRQAAWDAGASSGQLPVHIFHDKRKHIAWLLAVFEQNTFDLINEPMGQYLGQGLLESMQAGLLLADVHLGNIGMPSGRLLEEIGMTPIITDPGHAIPLSTRFEDVLVEEL